MVVSDKNLYETNSAQLVEHVGSEKTLITKYHPLKVYRSPKSLFSWKYHVFISQNFLLYYVLQ